MKRIILLISLFICVSSAYAQKEKTTTVKSVRGEYSVVLEYADITGREALQLAREDAKRKALEQVCGSRVNIWDQIETSSGGDSYNSLSINQIDGEIVEFEIIDEGHIQSSVRAQETIFFCVADVKVKKGIAQDPDFYAAVNGLKSVYYEGEPLLFDVTPYRNCYMKIFLFEDDKVGYMLYPNSMDGPKEIQANDKFDMAKAPYEFILEKSTDRARETNRLVFVFTKTERPFNSEVTSRAEIEEWIAKIPNDQKYLHFSIIEILDK